MDCGQQLHGLETALCFVWMISFVTGEYGMCGNRVRYAARMQAICTAIGSAAWGRCCAGQNLDPPAIDAPATSIAGIPTGAFASKSSSQTLAPIRQLLGLFHIAEPLFRFAVGRHLLQYRPLF